jgi:hypothetical protein
MSSVAESADAPDPEPQPATTAMPTVTKATRSRTFTTFMSMKYVLLRLACHNSTVSPRRLLKVAVLALALALALASSACRKSGVECMPPPEVTCPDGGGPSFTADVLPVFKNVCANCHAPGETEASIPLTTYQQIHLWVGEINNQVFLSCLMPPSNAPVPLSDDQGQTLLVWLACGAPDSPAVDAGAGD